MAVPERVVISGAGCCTALGHDLDSVARSLREGRDAFRASGALEGLSVCPAEDWGQDEARQKFEGWRHRHYLNRGSRMAVLSGLRALRDAGLVAPEQTATLLVLGMAGLFSASVRTPLTGAALVMEMCGGFHLAPAVLLTAFAAAFTANALHSTPVYDSLKERILDQRRRRRAAASPTEERS